MNNINISSVKIIFSISQLSASGIVFTIGWSTLFPFFLARRMGSYFDSSFFSFFDKDPNPVIPNFPNIYGECSLLGKASQFPLPVVVANLFILSMSLSHDMHFNCFLVNNASFSISSSSDITRMIYFIFDSKNNRAFFTSNLSLLSNIF